MAVKSPEKNWEESIGRFAVRGSLVFEIWQQDQFFFHFEISEVLTYLR